MSMNLLIAVFNADRARIAFLSSTETSSTPSPKLPSLCCSKSSNDPQRSIERFNFNLAPWSVILLS